MQLVCYPVAVVQYTFTHKHRNNTNNNRTTQITSNLEECGPCPVFASFTLAFALQLSTKHGKPSVRLNIYIYLCIYIYIYTRTHKSSI